MIKTTGLNEQQVKQRADRIGASEVPIIVMGGQYAYVNRCNQFDLWAQKVGLQSTDHDNWPMRAGRLIERTLLQFAAEEIGPVTRRNIDMVHSNDVMVAHLDGRLKDRNSIVECKSTGCTNRWWPTERWGDTGSEIAGEEDCSFRTGSTERGMPEYSDGIIPAEHYWQAQSQIACRDSSLRRSVRNKGKRWSKKYLTDCVYVVAQLPGMSPPFRWYKVLRNNHDIAKCESMTCDFVEKYLVTGQPPPLPPTDNGYRRQVLNRDDWTTIDNDLFTQLKAIDARRDALTESVNSHPDAAELKQVDKQWGELRKAIAAAGLGSSRITCEAGHTMTLKRSHLSYDRTNLTVKWQETPDAQTA